MKVALIGGTGFVGGYLVDELVRLGHSPSVLVRPGSEPKLRQPEKCHVVSGSLEDPTALDMVVAGCEAAVYNVGILREDRSRGITFERLQFQGAGDAIDAAKRASVPRFLLMSANGVKPSGTPYQTSKYAAEIALRESGLAYTIFRPSVIFGDPRGTMEFATQLERDMIATPLPGVGFHTGALPSKGEIRMSPVAVEDVATAFVRSLDDPATVGKSFELGGPEALTWSDILRRIAAAVDRRKLILPMSIGAMKFAATLLDRIPAFPVTRDQLTMLAEGNVADPDVIEALTGRAPMPFTPDSLGYLAAA